MSAQSLKKEVTLRQLFFLAFGSIIGVGWITVMGSWLSDAGAFGAALAFLAGSIVMVFVALCYAELATRFPAAGGEIVYAYEVFGLHASFIVGWLLAVAYTSVVIFELISVGWVFSALFPSLTGPTLYTVAGSDVTLGGLSSGIIGMALIAWFNIRSAKSAASLQEALSILLILVTLAFCVLAFMRGDVNNFQPAFVPSTEGLIWPGIIAVFITAPLWFGGFDAIPQALGEKSESVSMKGVPFVMVLSILAAALFYVAVILAASISLPRADLLAADLPVAEAITVAFGSDIGGKLVLFAGLLGLITGWNSFTFCAARVMFALGRAKIIFSVFGDLDEKRRTPVKAILFVSGVSIIAGFFGRSAILPIVDAGAFAFTSVYVGVCGAALWRAVKRPKESDDTLFNTPGGFITRGLAVAMTLAIAIYAFYLPYQSADGHFPVEWMIFLFATALGAVLYVMGAGARGKVSAQERSDLLLTEAN
ncbi:MAG: APC family permease [Pseudomonadota bacterium]